MSHTFYLGKEEKQKILEMLRFQDMSFKETPKTGIITISNIVPGFNVKIAKGKTIYNLFVENANGDMVFEVSSNIKLGHRAVIRIIFGIKTMLASDEFGQLEKK